MRLKRISTEHGGRLINVDLPQKKSLILRGSEGDRRHIALVLRALLSNDYSGFLMSDNSESKVFESSNSITFTDGELYTANKAVCTKGNIPKLHVVSCSGSGKIASFLIGDSSATTALEVDLTKYSSAIPDEAWIRMTTMLNTFLGYDFVKVSGNHLIFNYEGGSYTEEQLRTMYLLISESFATPSGYSRIVIIEEDLGLPNDELAKFIELLDNIVRFERVFYIGDLPSNVFAKNSSVGFVDL